MAMKICRFSALLGIFLAFSARWAFAAEVTVAVAANFASTMQTIAKAFAQDSGHQARLVIGSTGKFYAQIKNGAPFQVLLSGDQEIPLRLEKEGLGLAGSRFTYATGRLALWSLQSDLVDAKGEVLRSSRFKRLALADPRLAPYGAAAVEAMEKLGVWGQIKDRVVQGESVGQAFQFVASGNVELGFVALAQLKSQDAVPAGSLWLVPEELHGPLHQDALLLRGGETNSAAIALMRYLKEPRARAIMREHGYS